MEELKDERIEVILAKMGLIDQKGLMEGLEGLKKEPHKKLEEILLEKNIISEFDLIRAEGVKYNIPLVNLSAQKIQPSVLRYVKIDVARKNHLIPVHETEYTLYLATDNPFNYKVFEEISQVCGKQISVLLAPGRDIAEAININYIQQSVQQVLQEIEKEYGTLEDELEETAILNITDEIEEDNAVVKAVGIILEQAYQRKASDIHIEPGEKRVVIRLRIDGTLIKAMDFERTVFTHLVSRFKILGGLDISEKRIPQDGRMVISINEVKVNMRISTLPTIYGEKIVVRLLGSSKSEDIMSLEQMNIEDYNMESIKSAIHSPNGIILITGPTGSGKSTTVYGALKEVATPEVNVITVEDPVEKVLPGVNQVQVNSKTGLTFSAGLRSILRQDPDVVMIGEIRDSETVSIAARAAITGHLVISTLHTNDAPSSFMRMIDMGVEPYMVASSVVCVVAQRLMKKICKYCKEEYEPEEEELAFWKGEHAQKYYRGRGCPICNNTGYSGRVAIHEVVLMDPKLKEHILNKEESDVIKKHLDQERNFKDLGYNAQLLVERGITTLKELQKIRSSMDSK
jgi:type IV pilus assembly protein PilB